MTLNNRLRALEKQSSHSRMGTGASDRLSEELESRAIRLRSVPLEQAVVNAAPMDIAALALDGRCSGQVNALCQRFRHQPGPVGNLFALIGDLNDAA